MSAGANWLHSALVRPAPTVAHTMCCSAVNEFGIETTGHSLELAVVALPGYEVVSVWAERDGLDPTG